jgi:hypothetical protein
MKKIKPMKKTLSLSQQTIRVLTAHELAGPAGGFIPESVETHCDTFCPRWSCIMC